MMKNKNLKLNTLSGFEGSGKSTIIKYFQKHLNYYVIPETARLIMPLESNVLENSKDDLSYKVFISYLTNLHFLVSNKMNINCISDRSLIDSLTYLEWYSEDQKINIKKFGEFTDRFLDTYNRDFIYDDSFLILHPTDDEYIIKNVLSDKERKFGENVFQYKKDAKIWEDIFFNICEQLEGYRVFKNLHIVKSYPENKNVVQNVINLTKF